MAGGRSKDLFILFVALVAMGVAVGLRTWRDVEVANAATANLNEALLPESDGMVRVPGGEFLMGTPRPSPDDQRPVHRVQLAPFWIDPTHVTNIAFREFVDATNHRTTAEERGWSLMFDHKHGNWHKVEGVNWRHPAGPESSLAGKENFPVVHVSWHDAVAYATWAEKRLPTEAEYEFAARGGLSDSPFPWGRELVPNRKLMANYWQGKFPLMNLQQDGYFEVAPTKTFAPNSYGLYDMAGNVSSWCLDWYARDAYGRSVDGNLQGPPAGTERVLRGGSWASTAERGAGLHVGDRDHAPPDETSSRIGFRCARDVK
jgi:formylglycine-generating enzyme required for sulfatase activity